MQNNVLKYSEIDQSFNNEMNKNRFDELTELPDTKPLIIADVIIISLSAIRAFF